MVHKIHPIHTHTPKNKQKQKYKHTHTPTVNKPEQNKKQLKKTNKQQQNKKLKNMQIKTMPSKHIDSLALSYGYHRNPTHKFVPNVSTLFIGTNNVHISDIMSTTLTAIKAWSLLTSSHNNNQETLPCLVVFTHDNSNENVIITMYVHCIV